MVAKLERSVFRVSVYEELAGRFPRLSRLCGWLVALETRWLERVLAFTAAASAAAEDLGVSVELQRKFVEFEQATGKTPDQAYSALLSLVRNARDMGVSSQFLR